MGDCFRTGYVIVLPNGVVREVREAPNEPAGVVVRDLNEDEDRALASIPDDDDSDRYAAHRRRLRELGVEP